MQISLKTKLSALPRFIKRTKDCLAKLGLETVEDLSGYLPFRYEDMSREFEIGKTPFHTPCVIRGVVESVGKRYTARGALMITVRLSDGTGTIDCLFFNQLHLLRILKKSAVMAFYGERKLMTSLKNPFFVQSIVTEAGIVPVYSVTKGISQDTIRRVFETSKDAFKEIEPILPDYIAEKYNLPDKKVALQKCHFPTEMIDLPNARNLLALEELVTMLLASKVVKESCQKIKTTKIKIPDDLLKRFVESLPYQLTDSQKKVSWRIIQDLSKGSPMNRLLYGEVGSGKTIVGLLATLPILMSGQRAIWLSPTTPLANQHYGNLQKMLEPFGFTVGLSTGAVKKTLEANLIVGTHSLLNQKLDNLGMIIIDEQHRFGVEQRNLLLEKFPKAHLLMLSATPIPRTLAQTLLGHLDVTYLLGKPLHQKPVRTIVFDKTARSKITTLIKERLANGEVGYVVCPLINDPAEQVDLLESDRKAVTSELKNLKKLFPESKIVAVHGKIKPAEKETIFADFRAGKIDILLSTTVIEVGIDNPNASWILIEDADRFGLATLHQLRGRVGRGEKESICVLASSVDSTIAKRRLAALVESDNGLDLAEKDLTLRGPGEIIGFEQSGLPQMRYANIADLDMVEKAGKIVDDIADKPIKNYSALAKKLNQYLNNINGLSNRFSA